MGSLFVRVLCSELLTFPGFICLSDDRLSEACKRIIEACLYLS
ncbi:hypothetical protein OTSANNIE_1024 [Anaplasma phagocytophilum str. Annie]|nr:hypothetical protein OTSANNIE_1024 [Anaplasma phagocytophilum str. Annie]